MDRETLQVAQALVQLVGGLSNTGLTEAAGRSRSGMSAAPFSERGSLLGSVSNPNLAPFLICTGTAS
jgi:hypothetical protein